MPIFALDVTNQQSADSHHDPTRRADDVDCPRCGGGYYFPGSLAQRRSGGWRIIIIASILKASTRRFRAAGADPTAKNSCTHQCVPGEHAYP